MLASSGSQVRSLSAVHNTMIWAFTSKTSMSIGTGLPRAFAKVEKIALILISTTLSISLLAGALLAFTLALWLLGSRQLRHILPPRDGGEISFPCPKQIVIRSTIHPLHMA